MYPNSLIPEVNFTDNINPNCLINEYDLSLIRRIDLPLEAVYDQTIGIVFPSAFNYKEMPGMSMNLLCEKCDETSTNHRTTGKAIEPWDGGAVNLEDFTGDYYFLDNHTNVYLKIGSLHEIQFPLKYNSDPVSKKQLGMKGLEDIVEVKDNEGDYLMVPGDMKIVHRPTFLNYWHFELHINIGNELIGRNPNKTIKKALLLFIDQVLTGTAKINPPTEDLYDPVSCYHTA